VPGFEVPQVSHVDSDDECSVAEQDALLPCCHRGVVADFLLHDAFNSAGMYRGSLREGELPFIAIYPIPDSR